MDMNKKANIFIFDYHCSSIATLWFSL